MELLVVLLLGGYTYGGWRLWKGFKRTNYSPSVVNKLALSAMWLPLLVMNKSYRQNYTKALKG